MPGAPGAGLRFLTLLALACASASIGFAGYLYLVPFQGMRTELKRRAGELRSAQTSAEVRQKEVDRLHQDFVEVQGVSNQNLSAEGQVRSELRVLAAQIEQSLAPVGVKVTSARRRLLVRFPEDAVFDARGPWFSKQGQEALQTLAQLISDRAGRLVIAAPLGGATIPRWVRAQYPTAGDLSAARASNALKAMAKAGVRAETVYAVIGTMTSAEAATAPATLDVEIEP